MKKKTWDHYAAYAVIGVILALLASCCFMGCATTKRDTVTEPDRQGFLLGDRAADTLEAKIVAALAADPLSLQAWADVRALIKLARTNYGDAEKDPGPYTHVVFVEVVKNSQESHAGVPWYMKVVGVLSFALSVIGGGIVASQIPIIGPYIAQIPAILPRIPVVGPVLANFIGGPYYKLAVSAISWINGGRKDGTVSKDDVKELAEIQKDAGVQPVAKTLVKTVEAAEGAPPPDVKLRINGA